MMNDLLPAPPPRDLAPSTRDAIKRAVMAEIASPQPWRSATTRQVSRLAQLRRLRRVASAAAAILALLLVLPIVFADRNSGAASAREVLTRAAAAAAAQPSTMLHEGQYLLSKSLIMNRVEQDAHTLLVTTSRATWTASNGTGLIVNRAIDIDFESPAERAAWERSGERLIWGNFSDMGLHGEPYVCEYEQPGALFTPGTHAQDLDSFPSDPDALEQVLREEIINSNIAAASEAKQTSTMFDEIGSKLVNFPGSSQQRAAFFEVLARQPGIEALGTRTDHVGRVGTAIGATWYGVRTEMIVDPSTGRVLEFRSYQVDPQESLGSGLQGTPSPGLGLNHDRLDDPGTLLTWSTVVRMEVVNSLPPLTRDCDP
jgi:hypothetical protein